LITSSPRKPAKHSKTARVATDSKPRFAGFLKRIRLRSAEMAFDRDQMKAKTAALAAKGVFIGPSSWKYEG